MVTQCALRVATRMAACEFEAKARFGYSSVQVKQCCLAHHRGAQAHSKRPLWGRGWSGRSLRELTYFRLSATDGKTSAPSSYILSIVFVTNFFSFSFFWDTNSEKFDHGVNRRFLIKIDVIFFFTFQYLRSKKCLYLKGISQATLWPECDVKF